MSQDPQVIPQSELGELVLDKVLSPDEWLQIPRAEMLIMRERLRGMNLGVDPAKPGDDRTVEAVIHMNAED